MAADWFKALADRVNGVIQAVVPHGRAISDDSPVELSVEKDSNGKGILRVLLGAIWGADLTNEAWKGNIVRREPLLIQTHADVTVNASGSNSSATLTAIGYDSIAVGMKTNATHLREVWIQWFSDSAGTIGIGDEAIIPSASAPTGIGRVTVKGAYLRVLLKNTDAGASHVMSSWTTLLP